MKEIENSIYSRYYYSMDDKLKKVSVENIEITNATSDI